MAGRKAILWAALAAMFICNATGATGIMVPKERELPPLAIKSHRVNVRIEGSVATTRLSEEFLNSTNRRLEATYIFPVPREAALTDFAMYINGKRQSGEVVEADRARQIYQDIVRRLRDPGLLEYLDSGLLRMRVFPIEPNSVTEVEVTYTHPLPFESGVYEYTFPLKTGHKASRVLEDFTLAVDIASKQPIKNVYSPTHDIGVTRKDDYHALAGFEQAAVRLDTDFTVFYTVSREDFGLSLLTHRRKGEDGYFALMISPRVELDESKVMAKDVCFVIDTSGSMQEENRIESARQAVKFCLKALNPGDRFALITFSTGVEVFGEGLTEATPEAVEAAIAHVEKLEARGGTDLCGAVLEALGMVPDGERPYLTVLATDGKPTVGIKRPEEIIKRVEEANKANVRVFTFGIAEKLNVPLLDRIAQTTRGYSEYVAPGREIEAKISGFFRKVSHPVLSDLALSFSDVKVSDLYPQQMPDLFRGSQAVAFGRYSGSGDVAVELTGAVGGKEKSFTYDASFPIANAGNDFLLQLWARRKIGYLLDQIWLHGESKELTDEVVRLSKEYGIATPYTSYLVLEDEAAYRRHGIMRGQALSRLREAGVARAPVARAPAAAMEARARLAAQKSMLQGAAGAPGAEREAIQFSRTLRDWKEKGASARRDEARVRRVGTKIFVMLGGAYVDTDFTADMEILQIKFGSDAYFTALDAMPELKDYFTLGESVVVVINGKTLAVGSEGKDKASAEEIREFFGQ
ncbi:MAG: VIT and vWA domain-containing protein [Planctomycetota bacterium]|jgi:Ca-activated chloride channel family protein